MKMPTSEVGLVRQPPLFTGRGLVFLLVRQLLAGVDLFCAPTPSDTDVDLFLSYDHNKGTNSLTITEHPAGNKKKHVPLSRNVFKAT